jgi:hypothetical protein
MFIPPTLPTVSPRVLAAPVKLSERVRGKKSSEQASGHFNATAHTYCALTP